MQAIERQLRIYQTASGKVPYLDWFNGLRDQRTKQKVEARIGRIRLGNLGNARSVGDGVQELKIDYGPGFRVYFGQDGQRIVILLLGGDKRSQDKDIRKSKEYWADYKMEKRHANS